MTTTEAKDLLAVLRRISPCIFCSGTGTRWSIPEWDGSSVSAPCGLCEQTGVADVEARPWAKRLMAWRVNDLLGVDVGKDASRTRIAELEGAFDFVSHLRRQHEWSERTFGPGPRTEGVIDHIRKELVEVLEDRTIAEWIDVVILALDGAWRSGASPEEIVAAMIAKQTKNESRSWPDWRTAPNDKAIEHDRAARVLKEGKT